MSRGDLGELAVTDAHSQAQELVKIELLDGARSILRRGSIHELTVARMAEEAGLARPTAYRYFSHPRDVVYAIAEATMRQFYARLNFDAVDFPGEYARQAVKEFTSDSTVNRQVILYAGVQSLDGRWLPDDIHPETFLRNAGIVDHNFLVPLTYFRGAMFSWAAGFFTDEQFAEETERALAL